MPRQVCLVRIGSLVRSVCGEMLSYAAHRARPPQFTQCKSSAQTRRQASHVHLVVAATQLIIPSVMCAVSFAYCDYIPYVCLRGGMYVQSAVRVHGFVPIAARRMLRLRSAPRSVHGRMCVVVVRAGTSQHAGETVFPSVRAVELTKHAATAD